MSCPICGDVCRCVPQSKPDSVQSSQPEPSESLASNTSTEADGPAWREEVAARLSRYQSRRKPRPPRYPSLRLRFEDPPRGAEISIDSPSIPVSHHALALDEFADSNPSIGTESFGQEPGSRVRHEAANQGEADPPFAPVAATSSTHGPTAKIIEFPRSWTAPAPPLDELAEPVITGPRILEVPEVVPAPPAMGGITIETPQPAAIERRPGIDFPLHGASLSRRILAALCDHFIIATACAVFGFIFWKMTALRPPRLQIAEMATGALCLFWAAYQYLLIVYSGATPGLRLARLQLSRFDGNSTGRSLRRWRVLASFLSAISLGMGYVWVFLDEDSLCWHDRITHTYLAPGIVSKQIEVL
jgi:uncharacterized RDD family membrane protein YckC